MNYTDLMSVVIKSLSHFQRQIISELELILKVKCLNNYDRTIVLFIHDQELHFYTRLILMLYGRDFVVIPISMSNSEIITSIAETVKPLIITDSKKNIKSNSSVAKIFEIPEIHTTVKGESYIEISDILPHWDMTLYTEKREKVIVSDDIFAILVENLYENIRSNSLEKNPISICAPIDDFFIYYFTAYIVKPRNVQFIDEQCIVSRRKPEQNSTLFISYKSYREIWKEVLSLTLQNKILFKLFFNKLLGRIIMFVIIRKFEKYFRNYKNLVILGLVTDPMLAEISEKLRRTKVFNTYGEANSAMAFGMSNKLGFIDIIPGLKTISMSLKDNRKVYSIFSDGKITSSSVETSQLVMTIRDGLSLITISTSSLFMVKNGYAKFIGYSFSNGVCPMYIESIFNSFPFIKDSALVWYKRNYILVADIDEPILDANRINYLLFSKIMRGQVNKVNQDLLPDSVQIKSFGRIPNTALRYNRMGLLDKDFLYKVEFFG